MKMKNTIRYLVNSYRAVFKKNHIINNFGYIALVAVLVTGGISSACSYTTGIPQEDFMQRSGNFTVTVYPQSSLEISDPPTQTGHIKPGTNLVIHIDRNFSASVFNTGGSSTEQIWLEASQEGLEIGENEITITEWSQVAYQTLGQSSRFSSDVRGVLKIRK